MRRGMRSYWFIALLTYSLLSLSAYAQEKLDISGISVNVIAETEQPFTVEFSGKRTTSMAQSVVVVIPVEQYARESLEKIWKHFSEKYRDKTATLDVRIFVSPTYEYNHRQFGDEAWVWAEQFVTCKSCPRKYEARFERLGFDSVSGEARELLVYLPDLNKPDERRVIVLAGK